MLNMLAEHERGSADPAGMPVPKPLSDGCAAEGRHLEAASRKL